MIGVVRSLQAWWRPGRRSALLLAFLLVHMLYYVFQTRRRQGRPV